MTNLELCLIFGSALLGASAFFIYFRGALRSSVRPNRWSWMIWTFGSGVEVLTFQAVSSDVLTSAVFWFSFAASFATTLLIWFSGTWRRPDKVEIACAGASLAGLTVAVGFGHAWWAHLIVLFAIPLSFIPTYCAAAEDYRQEDSVSWILWTCSDVLALAYVLNRFESAQEIPYPAVEMVCHGMVWLIVFIARAKVRSGVSERPSADQVGPVKVGTNHLGKAVFAARALRAGDFILQIKGDLIPSYEMPQTYHGARDRYMQVDSNLFIGPSGGADDLVNHSCDPNAGIRFTPHGMLLVALREIAPGEEISWDYSTTMLGIDWSMRCDCRTTLCRGEVAEFSSLPADRQAYYASSGVLAPFIEERLRKQQQIEAWLQDATEDRSRRDPTSADLRLRIRAAAG